MGIVSKTVGVYKRYGLKGFCTKLNEKISSPMRTYGKRVAEFLPTEEELGAQREHRFLVEPCISIVVPAYETNEQFLKDLLASLEGQSYDNWELCIADGSRTDQVERVIRERIRQYEDAGCRYKIRYERLKENNGISENTNEGLKLVTGSYVGFMDHDDVLERNALFEVVNVINTFPDADVIYSDEDKVSHDLTRHTQPHFKPDFNLELLRDNNYICHFLVVSRPLLADIGGFRKEYDGSQDYDFILRAAEKAKRICHIPKILYHWRMHAASTAGDSDSKEYTFDAGKRALEAHFKRLGIEAEVEKRIEVGCFHICYQRKEAEREEDYILLLPDGVKPITEGWKEELISCCMQERVGIVGGKTIGTNGKVLQNGYICGKGGEVRTLFAGLPEKYKGYCRRAVLAQEVGAVSFAFAVIKKEAFDRVGGVDETLPHPYLEMDFCRRLRKAGYAVVQASGVEAVVEKEPDYRSICGKVGSDVLPLTEAKKKLAKDVEESGSSYDPCYNPNFAESGKTFTL